MQSSIEVQQELHSWVSTSLNRGKILSHKVLERIDSKANHANIIVGDETKLPEINHQTINRALSTQRVIDLLLIAKKLINAIDPATALTIIIEDDLALQGDTALQHVQHRIMYLNETVLHILSSKEGLDAMELSKFIASSASGFPLNGFLVPSEYIPADNNVNKNEAINAIAKEITSVFVSAFEREGVILLELNK